MGTYETDVTTFRALLAGLPIVSESGTHAHRGMVALTVGEHGMRARSTDLLDTWANAHVGSIEAGNVGYFRLSALKAAIKGSKGALKVTLDSTGTLRLGIVQLQSLDGSDYSDALNIPADSDSAPSVTVETTDLAWVAKAASKDTYPANLSGIMFRNGQACATDRFRLHVVETCGDTIETLIPVKAMRPLLTSGARILRVSADDNGSRMSAYEGKRGVSRVWRFRRAIDSQFPQWDRLFPDTYSTRILIGLSDLGPALAQSVGVDVGNRVTLDMAGRTLTAESETSSVKAAIDSVTVTDGLALTVGFNAAYMTDLLDGSQLAALGFNGDRKPIVLHDMGGKRGLVMPIHK